MLLIKLITATLGIFGNAFICFVILKGSGVSSDLGVIYEHNNSNMVGRINFNTRHLTKGDPVPRFNGKPRVYTMRYCPFGQRTVLALNAKGVDFEVVNIDLIDKPEWFTSKSPQSKVPTLEIADGVSITESLVTVEYIDDVYPQRPLLPKDPLKKAFDKILVESTAGPINAIFFRLVKAPETITPDVVSAYFKALDMIQEELQKRGTTFLDGQQPGFADYGIWPWLERIVIYDDPQVKIGPEYKILLAYIQRMYKDPAVSAYLLTKEDYWSYLNAIGQGKKPNYNELVQE